MKPLHAVSTRLPLVVLAVVIVSAVGAETAALYSISERLVDESLERSAASFLGNLGRRLQPMLGDRVDTAGVFRIADEIRETLPGARLYLIEASDGSVRNLLRLGAIQPRMPDTEPLRRFAMQTIDRTLPVYGHDPDVGGTGPFAATEILYRHQPAYLYLMLRNLEAKELRAFKLDQHMALFVVTTFVTLMIIIAACGFFLARLLNRRFAGIASALHDFSAGDYSTRVEVVGDDEIAALSRTVNVMADKVEKSVSEIAHRDQLRRELVANVAHDLRGPASVINSHTHLLCARKSVLADAEALIQCESIRRSAAKLATLLAQLFELAKFEAREHAVRRVAFSVDEMVEEIVHGYQPAAAEHGIRLEAEIGDLPAPVLADPDLIGRVLTNLLENALTYTLKGGSVLISVHPGGAGAAVSVQDTGVGIAAGDLSRICEPKYRVNKWVDRRPDSGGLGLAIVSRILEAHGSHITVKSSEGEGTCFAFVLPWVDDER